jgi:MFS family permease
MLAVGLMLWFENDIRTVMWFAAVPALVTVAVLVTYVREPERAPRNGAARVALTWTGARRLPRRYWRVVLVGVVFTLARFSEAFLVLRAQGVGLALGYVPAVMIVMNILYAGAAYPAGAAADQVNQGKLLLVGLVLLIGADIVLALATSPLIVFAGAALWGLHMAFTQGLLSKLVAETCPAGLLGTGFGVFNLVSGVVLLLASVLAGSLWSLLGPPVTFLAGATFAALAAIGLLAFGLRHPPRGVRAAD